jgi:hypothetical protein
MKLDVMAIEIQLDLTIMDYRKNLTSKHVLGLTNVNFDVQDLWNSVIIEITNPAESKTKEQREEEMSRLLEITVNEQN